MSCSMFKWVNCIIILRRLALGNGLNSEIRKSTDSHKLFQIGRRFKQDLPVKVVEFILIAPRSSRESLCIVRIANYQENYTI